jgi:Phage tail lysozyme
MTLNPAAIGYAVAGGLIAYSGIKGATIADTAKAVLSGNLTLQDTETIAVENSSGGTGTNEPSSDAASGDTVQNGTTIYKYLRSAGYTPIQAAGAIASIYGESTWNPEAVGTGGAGLIAWTPPSTMSKYGATCHAAGIGNNTTQQDFDNQLPAILSYVSETGVSGAVSLMQGAGSVDQAAEIWGQKVEKYGIDDVHTQGVDLAVQIAKSVDNVTLVAG